jgi:hypothetical protein
MTFGCISQALRARVGLEHLRLEPLSRRSRRWHRAYHLPGILGAVQPLRAQRRLDAYPLVAVQIATRVAMQLVRTHLAPSCCNGVSVRSRGSCCRLGGHCWSTGALRVNFSIDFDLCAQKLEACFTLTLASSVQLVPESGLLGLVSQLLATKLDARRILFGLLQRQRGHELGQTSFVVPASRGSGLSLFAVPLNLLLEDTALVFKPCLLLLLPFAAGCLALPSQSVLLLSRSQFLTLPLVQTLVKLASLVTGFERQKTV